MGSLVIAVIAVTHGIVDEKERKILRGREAGGRGGHPS